MRVDYPPDSFNLGGNMTIGINKVILIGHLGKDVELRKTQSGKSVASFSLATSESYKNSNGDKQTSTEWHNILVWGKLADLVNQYLKKGSPAYLEGKVTYRSWEDKDGNKKYRTEIVAKEIKFLGSGGSNRTESAPPSTSSPNMPSMQSQGENMYGQDEDLPF